MNRTELFDLIRNGENSTLEFKRGMDIQNHDLAKELVAFPQSGRGYCFCSASKMMGVFPGRPGTASRSG